MAVSAFRSTSKRGNFQTSTSNTTSSSTTKPSNSEKPSSNKASLRRSRSVSALSRSSIELPSSSSSSSIIDFLNKRDNPLFCNSTTTSPQTVAEQENLAKFSKLDENVPKVKELAKRPVGMDGVDSRRGRSVSRNAELMSSGVRKDVGRSLSRVDTGRRRRSVSREHYENPEHLQNQDIRNTTVNTKKAANDFQSSFDRMNLTTSSSRIRHSHPSDGLFFSGQETNWEDGISTSSFSEAEEKTIKAVYEQVENNRPADDAGAGEIYEAVRSEVRLAISEIQNDLKMAIHRTNSTVITRDNVGDIPPELVNPDAVELVSDIRREYAIKLEQSHERARKLRSDLAVEEQRGQELDRILKEILPEPKASETRQSRFRRKSSSERRKMSRRLTEEAMHYFDECVSISTFDSSDFSSTEDPPSGFVASTPLVDKSVCFPFSSSASNHGIHGDMNFKKELDSQVQRTLRYEGSNLTRGSSSKDPIDNPNKYADSTIERNSLHSPASEHAAGSGICDDIRDYVKKFEKKILTDSRDHSEESSYYDSEDYELRVPNERFLLDRVSFSNQILSGRLVLCGNGITI